jgi:hypothetical protein
MYGQLTDMKQGILRLRLRNRGIVKKYRESIRSLDSDIAYWMNDQVDPDAWKYAQQAIQVQGRLKEELKQWRWHCI